jgi:hypothetical protein
MTAPVTGGPDPVDEGKPVYPDVVDGRINPHTAGRAKVAVSSPATQPI